MFDGIIVNIVNMSFKIALIPDLNSIVSTIM